MMTVISDVDMLTYVAKVKIYLGYRTRPLIASIECLMNGRLA